MSERTTVPRLVVAGIGSGAGKTTVALGLVGALRGRGRSVQTFKVGPDFVDCAYLAHASRRPCRSLDSWMLGAEGATRSFVRAVGDADAAIIEGTVGIFDGHGGPDGGASSFPGSTAELAHLCGAPVVLVIDASTTAETAAALALGVRRLDPDLDIIGVILNNVPNDHRRQTVEDATWRWAKLPVLGALPRLPGVQIPEVRTGLLPISQNPHVDAALEEIADAVARHCDVDLIERLMARTHPLHVPAVLHLNGHAPRRSEAEVRVGVAFDDAFCFYYAENLELLEAAGASVVTFSPLDDGGLPRDLDAVYLGGGVSEMFVPRLAANHAFLDSLRRANARGLPIYAEGSGAMYTARSVRTSDGAVHEMASLLPVDIALEPAVCRSGYRDLRLRGDSILGPVGTSLRGHEFHWCRLLSNAPSTNAAYSMHDADGEPLGCEGWTSATLLASLVHLHFDQEPQPARHLVAAARSAAAARRTRMSQATSV
ncbi:MAG: cobyrinate a,c-diamide synthase [Candidatus Dormibacteria bacterium]